MHPGATLFLDACVQSDLWSEGSWPIVTEDQAQGIGRLFALARDLGIRQGGVVCRHGEGFPPAVAGAVAHGIGVDAARVRPLDCVPVLPMIVVGARRSTDEAPILDRAHAIYVDSGCASDPDADPAHARAFGHLVAGVRDAVVFGVAIEHGLAHAVTALLRRRIRVHVALDATAAADETVAQLVIADWKRRGVDGATVDTIARLLRRG